MKTETYIDSKCFLEDRKLAFEAKSGLAVRSGGGIPPVCALRDSSRIDSSDLSLENKEPIAQQAGKGAMNR
jgi:hypothetical protein